MKHVLVIFGSTRSDGLTMDAVKAVTGTHKVATINLREKDISYYDYENKNREDDFLNIAELMTRADIIIFATPVYWYAMSAVLKTFFDRFTDLITIRKDLGRALKGRECYLICTGAEKIMPEGFEIPFVRTCDYMDMDYKGGLYYYTGTDEALTEDNRRASLDFGNRIFGQETEE